MPILGSLLPGLRDLRVPLVVGIMWMLTLAIATDRWLPESSAARPLLLDATRAVKAIDYGPLAALLMCAYLVGAATAVTRIPRLIDKIFNSAASAVNPDYFPNYRDEVSSFFGAKSGLEPPLPTDSIGMHVGTVIHLTPGLRKVLYARWLWLWPWLRKALRELNRRFIPHRLNYGTVMRLNRIWDRVQYPPQLLYLPLLRFLEPPLDSGNFGWRLSAVIRARIQSACGPNGSATTILEANLLSPAAMSELSQLGYADQAKANEFDDPSDYERNLRKALVRAIITGLESDFESIVSRLQAQNADLHERFDRTSSESEMRIGVTLPLSALLIVTAFAYQWPWAVLGLLLTTVLFVRGWKKRYEADSIVWSAVAYQLIEIPELAMHPAKRPTDESGSPAERDTGVASEQDSSEGDARE